MHQNKEKRERKLLFYLSIDILHNDVRYCFRKISMEIFSSIYFYIANESFQISVGIAIFVVKMTGMPCYLRGY